MTDTGRFVAAARLSLLLVVALTVQLSIVAQIEVFGVRGDLMLLVAIGALLGRRITPTELPQMVAALHSVVGLAAVLTSIGSVLADVDHVSTLHLVTAYLGVLIGTTPRRLM